MEPFLLPKQCLIMTTRPTSGVHNQVVALNNNNKNQPIIVAYQKYLSSETTFETNFWRSYFFLAYSSHLARKHIADHHLQQPCITNQQGQRERDQAR
jgi:hypothetical protein